MAKKIEFKWNVWIWDVNQDALKSYNVGDYFVRIYKKLTPKKRPKTREEVEIFLNSEARYQFWSRCEYEVIIHSWPHFKNDKKVDVFDQLKLNWDVFVDSFCKAIGV